MTWPPTEAALRAEREAWRASGGNCFFCSGPSYPWVTDDETWAKVEPILGQEQACFECFAAAWSLSGLSLSEPFRVAPVEVAEQRGYVGDGTRTTHSMRGGRSGRSHAVRNLS